MCYPTRQRASIRPNSSFSSSTPSAPVHQLPEHPAHTSHSSELLVSAALLLHHWKILLHPFRKDWEVSFPLSGSSAPSFISMMHLSRKTNDPWVHTASAPQAPLQQTPLTSFQSAVLPLPPTIAPHAAQSGITPGMEWACESKLFATSELKVAPFAFNHESKP